MRTCGIRKQVSGIVQFRVGYDRGINKRSEDALLTGLTSI